LIRKGRDCKLVGCPFRGIRFSLAQSQSRTDADDLLQETWLRIHKVRYTPRPGEAALPWFYAIARHVRVDHYRKSVRTVIGERQLEAMSEEAAAVPRESDHAAAVVHLCGAAGMLVGWTLRFRASSSAGERANPK
jgi:DNA-directed RNA polymerase specialized sigma24 family protein